jgi:membrane fusion protein (multidrug efflux system)
MAETTEQRRTIVTDGKATNGAANGAATKTVVTEETVEKKGPVKRILPFVFLAILIAGAIYGWHIIQYNKVHETTDDAQIDADISPIIPRIAGYVTGIYVAENQQVDSNTVLVQLDAKDLELKATSAEAGVENAKAAVRVAEAAATASRANVTTANVARSKTAEDVARAQGLYKGNAITKEQLDAARAAAESAEAQWKAASDQANAAETQVAVAQSLIKQRESDLENARLQASYATIVSSSRGTVAKKNVEMGQFVAAGTPLMAITQSDIWITANFKETQLEDIRPGQRVEFTVDAYPDNIFHGTVQSISPATGAKFSLLPPDNASGNFVKVTQRVPVRILVDRGNYTKTPLRPGMSVDVTVTTGK